MTVSFVPPLRLAGTPAVYISSLHDAIGILRDYIGRRPRTRDLIFAGLLALRPKRKRSMRRSPFAGGRSKKDCCTKRNEIPKCRASKGFI
jgi:hypothetical protein